VAIASYSHTRIIDSNCVLESVYMKKSQKGFIAPLILIIIAILVLGGGAYVYTQQKQVNPPVTENVALPHTTSTQTTTQASSTTQNFAESKKVVPNSQCANIHNDLSVGSTDVTTKGEVSILQNFLRSQGWLKHEATGYYDDATALAVKKLQTISGLETSHITGSLGPMERGILIQVSCLNASTYLTSQETFEIIARSNSVNEKRNHDAVIQRNLATIQTQAEIYYGGTGANSYGTAGSSCSAAVFSDATIAKAIAGAEVANGDAMLVCNNSTTAYAVASKLSFDTARYWCVDSIGGASKSKTVLGTNTVCPAAN